MNAATETASKPTIKAGDTFVCQQIPMHRVPLVGWAMGASQDDRSGILGPDTRSHDVTKMGKCFLYVLEVHASEALDHIAVVRKKYVTPNGDALFEGRIHAKRAAIVEKDIKENAFAKMRRGR